MNTLIIEDGSSQRKHLAHLENLLATTSGMVRIASPYVTNPVFLTNLGGRDTRLLTTISPMDIVSGATKIETLRVMLDSGIEINVLPEHPKLHAKVYIFGISVAVVTSANLTFSAFNSNLEVGAEIHGEDVIKLINWFDQLWTIASPLKTEHLAELQRKADILRREFVKISKKSRAELMFPENQTHTRLTNSLQNLFETAPRFFVCNTNRRYSERTATGGYVLEQKMFSRRLAIAWTAFKFPDHMEMVEPGDGVFMFAKGIGIIGIGIATAKRQILPAADPARLRSDYDGDEWRIPLEWVNWTDDANAFHYPTAPNFSFWNVTESQYDNFRESIKMHFLEIS